MVMGLPVGTGLPLVLRLAFGQIGGDFYLINTGPARHGILVSQNVARRAQARGKVLRVGTAAFYEFGHTGSAQLA